jgi:thioredoxin-related protein
MKTVVLLFLFMASLFAKLEYAKDYATALKMAKSEDKQILLMLSKENCPACYWMKNVAFYDDALVAEISKNYISVIVDVEHDATPMNLDFIGTPTFYLLTNEEDARSRIDGAISVEKFMKRLKMLN